MTRHALRTALQHADTVRAGAILRVVDDGVTRWVVLSAGTATGCDPDAQQALAHEHSMPAGP
jgi:hypothetical protein